MPWQPPPKDKGKAIAFVAGLHLLLGTALIHGLAAEPLRRSTAEALPVDVALASLTLEPDPPPPDDSAAAARDEAGSPDLKARPAPIVVPPPRVIPTRNPLPTADESAADTGSAPSAGAALAAGPGRGAGGAGDGGGGGGSGGDGAGSGSGLSSEARLLSGNLTRSDYRRIRGYGSPAGRAVLGIDVGPEGRVTGCQPVSGSGNPLLDTELCRLLSRTRWEPARDRSGRPVLVSLRYVATWNQM
jgi:protein TonB